MKKLVMFLAVAAAAASGCSNSIPASGWRSIDREAVKLASGGREVGTINRAASYFDMDAVDAANGWVDTAWVQIVVEDNKSVKQGDPPLAVEVNQLSNAGFNQEFYAQEYMDLWFDDPSHADAYYNVYGEWNAKKDAWDIEIWYVDDVTSNEIKLGSVLFY